MLRDRRQARSLLGCDFLTLNVSVPARFYEGFLGGVEVTLNGFEPFDVDLGIFRR